MRFSFQGNNEAERVINLIKYTNKSVFLTGKAGTGKSTLLKHIISDLKKEYVLLAPTGIAALNVKGQTIHSFFGFGIRPYLPKDRDLPNLLEKVELLQKIEVIIIDEISMVRADIMNAIDLTLKKFLKSKLPFGGKQLLLVGDLLQLPPVVNNKNEEEVRIIRENYETEFFFSSLAVQNFKLETIELQKIYRQEGVAFIKVLNNIRVNQASASDLSIINSRVKKSVNSENVIVLTTKNNTVDRINSQRLANIKKPENEFYAKKTGTFTRPNPNRRYPADDILRLKKGAQIIFIKNDSERRWVNGTIAKISSISSEEIEVNVNGYNYVISKELWEDIEYKWNKEEDKIEKEVVGTFEQYPIRLAWAITIHKSQGQTFDKSIIDMDTGAFAFGQTYVALSRCTSLEGISLTRKINMSDIKVSHKAIEYLLKSTKETESNRENLELDLIDRLKELEIRIEEVKVDKQSVEIEKNKLKIVNYRLKSENESLEKEIIRLKKISWIQKLLGAN